MSKATREQPTKACLSALAGERYVPRLGKGTLGTKLRFATQLIKH